MAEYSFTDEQLSAIETRDKTLLVSAAAGSGKTATLTERIIRSILDENKPEDISGMLIVTFTTTAVEDLKKKITKALRGAIAKNPENERLSRQLYMLAGARICTIDSFCNDVLKMGPEKFGVSPNYRIADATEVSLLTKNTLASLIEACYNGDLPEVSTPTEFEELTTALTSVKATSSLEDTLAALYEKTKSIEEGVEIFAKFANEYKDAAALPVEENAYGRYAIDKTVLAAKHYKELFSRISYELGDTKNEIKYFDAIPADLAILERIIEGKTYEDIASVLNAPLPSLPTIRGEKTEPMLAYRSAREEMKKVIFTTYKNSFFSYSKEAWEASLSSLSTVIARLYRFLSVFDRVYFEEKRRHNVLEHSDVERLAYLSLYNKDGERSELAISLSESFSSVYIDEYQDVNALQNKIFEAVSRRDNRFMVGDIKQSIYGFRSAKPEIFASMKSSLPAIDSGEISDAFSIFMSANFRCDEPIIDYVNEIFDPMFTITKEAIGYVNQDKLVFKKVYENGDAEGKKIPEICVFDKSVSASVPEDNEWKEDEDEDEEETDSAENSGEELDSPSDLPPLFTANKIKELLSTGKLNNGNPIRPSDIAIILRKNGGRSKVYADALEELGIPVRMPEDKDFFLNSEVQLVLCLLNAIDNPRKDIYLAGLMLSPLFDFTADELYLIRKIAPRGTLWESLCAYSESNPEDTKASGFIVTLNHYRTIAEGVKVDALILRLYNETGILALASRTGTRENLMLLYSYARKFEASDFEGLYSFISYINTVIESDTGFILKAETEESDAVTIMTAHKSKGLEYPVVFVADAGVSLVSKREKQGKLPYNDKFGLALKLRTENELALVDNPIFSAINEYNVDKVLTEELRVYYVALTRAREQLYITGVVPSKSIDDYTAKIELYKKHLSPYSITQMKTFIDILFTVGKSAAVYVNDLKFLGKMPDTPTRDKYNEEECVTDERLDELLCKRFSFKYEKEHLTRLPEKLSISKLHPAVLDDTNPELSMSIEEKREKESTKRTHVPEFVSGTREDESARMGIITHNFLQFFDPAHLSENGAEAELERLISERFISEENKHRVRLDEIKLFEKSELFSKMKSAKKLYREFRFNCMLPARLFTESEEQKKLYYDEQILLQGVIDCIYEDECGNLHLVDYKTDRLTKSELSDVSLAKATLERKHALQLSYYSLAVEKIFGRAPASVGIYSLPLGKTLEIDPIKFD